MQKREGRVHHRSIRSECAVSPESISYPQCRGCHENMLSLQVALVGQFLGKSWTRVIHVNDSEDSDGIQR